jgi:L-threonylcarbamoyladenylate synthase
VIARAVEVLRDGGLVAFPTETVYGLGADATNPTAVRRIYDVKGRPADHPLIVHLATVEELDRWAADVPTAGRALAHACWPGPLTLLLPRHPDVSDVVTGGRGTIGLRVPAHPLALELLRAFGGGIAAPSANRFGRVSPTTADHVRADLGDDVDLILDGGPSRVGVESTIVDVTLDPPVVLRPGGVPVEVIEAIIGGEVRTGAAGPRRAPGMLASHYAPAASIEIIEDATAAWGRAEELATSGRLAEVLDPGPDVARFAHGLYGWLRDADDRGVEVLIVVPPPDVGLGWAIRDRLRKASAPRPGTDDDAT